MRGRICLVTGATDGIGWMTARALARDGARVVLVGRNQAKGEMRAAALRAETGNDAVGFERPTSRRRGTSAPSPGGSPRSCRVSTCS